MRKRIISFEKKLEAVEKYKRGEGSQIEICKRYKIQNTMQLRDWITLYNGHKEYELRGVDSLIDKRGKHKPLDEMTEVELLRAENKMLKAENEQKKMEIAVLKKVQEI